MVPSAAQADVHGDIERGVYFLLPLGDSVSDDSIARW
jgi:hypothetical protein